MSQNVFAQTGVSDAVYSFGEEVLASLRPRFDEIDRVAEYNQAKVISAMQKNRVNVACFRAQPVTAITTSAATRVSAFMPTASIRKPRLSVRRSPAAHTRSPSP